MARDYKDGVIRGRDLMLFRNTGTEAAPVWVALGAATSHSLSIQADNSDISNKDTAQFKTVLPGGNLTWTISADCMYKLDDADELVTDIIEGNVYMVCFGIIKNPSSSGAKPPEGWQPLAGNCYMGQAFLQSFEVNAPYEGQATYSAQFQGSGPLQKMPATQQKRYEEAFTRASAAQAQADKGKKGAAPEGKV
jgi:predicted secreted protein